MEPEIIRMYSSSPPPLDSVADDDDEDEFGEFGDFSGVGNSGMGFAEFATVGYSKTQEEFIPAKPVLPIQDYSDSLNNFTSLTAVKDTENILETDSKKGQHGDVDTHGSYESNLFNVPAFDDKGNSGEKIKKADLYSNFVSPVSSGDDTEFTSRSLDSLNVTCNGEKVHSEENLTNGFAAGDSVNPQGIEDRDSIDDSKGYNTIANHNTDPSSNFLTSTAVDFADFSTFSKKDSIHLGGTELQSHKGIYEGQDLSITSRSPLSSVENGSPQIKDVVTPISGNGDGINTLVLSNCTSETGLIIANNVAPHDNVVIATDIDAAEKTPVPLAATEETIGKLADGEVNEEVLETTDEHGCTSHNNAVGRTENVKQSTSSIDNGEHSLTIDSSVSEAPCANSLPCFTDSSDSNNTSNGMSDDKENDLSDNLGDFNETNATPFQAEIKPAVDEQLTFSGLGVKCPEADKEEEFSEFGDFGSLAKDDEQNLQDFDDFADFSSATNIKPHSDWNAFDDDHSEGPSWAVFVDEKDSLVPDSETWTSHRTDVQSSSGEWDVKTENINLPIFPESGLTSVTDQSTDAFQQSLQSRFDQVIQVCFPLPPLFQVGENISCLDHWLKVEANEEAAKPMPSIREVLDLWADLQKIHDAYGLKYQWGGSHSNKKLLRSLGIDTRNILFTGNKKQPVIVPMYAASLGMLEPTKPLSAAEKIASIGQSSPVPPEELICTTDQMQESLPPVQFDWSSSGLTNPLDGVDPELYELTTSKLESVGTSSKVTDAFARLMSTAETTSTSTRKPRRDENLSEEAAKVIASLPDLSFMYAKVLMFPATLTPSTSAPVKAD
ncbi:aftiphilin S homeolog [Xenopus laevis]|uniref:Aftiphilin S homeolog n=1 Tax=Xenopus laevis TaxID=8355 RepID=A0JMU0_XENLA|nr:aftiphilin S homeolog [Xenopus laevis]AAI26005.1 MGC115640 protein [Xenopus laevis]